VALIVFAKDVKPKLVELKKFVRKQVGVRSPRQFTIVKEIPRNVSGKISRTDAMTLSTENKQVRRTIVEALADACATDPSKSSLLTAFENGERVVRLKKLGIDSLARMEIMVALEVNHDVIIMPHEFPRLRTLDDIAARVLQPPLQDELSQNSSTSLSESSPTPIQIDTQPYVVRFFRRIFSYCHTAAHLNKALTTLESRLTPTEVECLYEWHLGGQLFPSNTAAKFQSILVLWYQRMKRMMLGSGKSQPEPFVSHKITYTVTHFVGPGSPADKTLLVCFSIRGNRRLMIPNAALMQHTDSGRYDLLIISEPLGVNYQRGVPGLGKNLIEVIEWLAKLKLIGDYSRIRTLGCSAGGYAAVIAGHLLGAEMAVSVGGRIPSNHKHPINILHMIFTTWRAMRKGHCPRVLVSYGADKSRDRKFASVMARLFGSNPDVVEFENEKVGHSVLARLVERGELAPYLARTIFSEINDELISTEQEACPDFRDHRDINTLPRGCDQ
jgi:acyl carrier protein